MVRILLFIFVLLLSLPADAAYKIYLRNGSVISGVSTFEKGNGEVTIFFGGGSMGIPAGDILKIEDTEAAEKDFRIPSVPGGQEETVPEASQPEESGNKGARTDALRAELDSVNSEIQAVEEEEAKTIKAINDRKGSRLTYNALQLRQLESDLAPLQQELSDLQVRKGALYQRRATIEGELRSLQ
jgi:hypothetical protein